MEEALQDQETQTVDRREKRGFILGSMSVGHGISHLYDLGLPLIIQEIASTSAMNLGGFQVAGLFALRQASSGIINLGGGPIIDTFKSHWGIILTGCMIWSAIAYAAIGASPNYTVLILAILLVSIPGTLWHLPAAAALSQRFPDRRGFAMSIHGSVANICNYLGPLLAAGLLSVSVLYWRPVLFIYAGPALIMSVFVWWSLKNVGGGESNGGMLQLKTQFREAGNVIKNPIVMGLVAASVVRGIGLNAVAHWTPFYLKSPLSEGGLNLTNWWEYGVLLGLLAGMGIVSAPILGILSDRVGRKVILVPGFIFAGIISFLVVSASDNLYLLALVMAGMGLFNFALHQIIQASVLDVVGRGTEATAIGLLFGLGGVIGAASPFLATLVIEWQGYQIIYYYSGILALVSAVMIFFLPIRKQAADAPVEPDLSAPAQ